MILQVVDRKFSICKVEETPVELLQREFTFFGRTDGEISLICESKYVPDRVITAEHGWRCFRIAEDASFDKYGMISYLSGMIAEEKASTLVVATFDTDYLFVKEEKFPGVVKALERQDCSFLEAIL